MKYLEPGELHMTPDAGRLHGSYAEQYDDLCARMESHAHEVLFGMAYEYVVPGQRLLDLGIGTGLCAALFHRAGLEVYGADFSEEMLRLCEEKKIAVELKAFDIGAGGWPYGDGQFRHVTACGLFHFIRDPGIVFSEAWRVLSAGGTFGFTVKDPAGGGAAYVDPEYGIAVYCHDDAHVRRLAEQHGFALAKRLAYYAYTDLEKKERSLFTAYVLVKAG